MERLARPSGFALAGRSLNGRETLRLFSGVEMESKKKLVGMERLARPSGFALAGRSLNGRETLRLFSGVEMESKKKLVGMERLELSWHACHMDLNHARLPVPPHPHWCYVVLLPN